MNYEIIEQHEIECLSPKDVKDLLRVSRTEAYNIFRREDFPSFKIGEKMLRVTKADFNRWLAMQKGA